jgi:peptidoglycan L-alanyl-D-glutamate endopeptidase CwlK
MDKITLDRIEFAHPKIRQELRDQYLEINSMLPKNCRLRFAYVFRTPQEQAALFKKRPKVTNADAWQSIHNYGLEFDIVLLYDHDGNVSFEESSWSLTKDIDKDKTPEWTEVVNYFKSKGWTWGGDWKSFKDAPHFEKTFSHTWRTLKPMIEGGKIIIDNNTRYPKI